MGGPPSANIAVVDDDEDNAAFLATALSRAGFVPFAASRPDDAMKWLSEQSSLPLIILDVVMPQMSGTELAHHICAKQGRAEFLFVSGTPVGALSKQTREELQRLPSCSFCYLPKPFTFQSLLECVRCRLDGNARLPQCRKHGLSGRSGAE